MNVINITNQKFGRLTVIKRYGSSEKRKEATWLCKCDCGNIIHVTSYHLRHGHTRSCGCLLREVTIKRNIVHNLRYTSAYSSWRNMRHRCLNKDHKHYSYYGGRGITVCKRWEKYENFYADMGERPAGMTLDRIDNSKGYCPSNCRWVSRREQSNNMRNNHRLEYKGENLTIAEWSRKIGISYGALWHRLKRRGWSIERVLNGIE